MKLRKLANPLFYKFNAYKKNSIDQRAVLILGMHRSGTSCLTGSLQRAGLYLAEHHTWNPYNKLGNRENPEIFDFHENLLAANNGTWDNPPSIVEWNESHMAWGRNFIRQFDEYKRWGFKDPRTLLTLSGWKSLLPNASYVGIFRHPIFVYQSLNARSPISQEKAFTLWLTYNHLLLQEYKNHPFPILCFDWEPKLLNERLKQVCDNLGLNPNSDRFYEPDLHHHTKIQKTNLPSEITALYNALVYISKNQM